MRVPESNPNSEALKIWREKLAYLQNNEGITADPSQKFALRHQIQEARAKISVLTQALQKVPDALDDGVAWNDDDAALRVGTAPAGIAEDRSKSKPLSNEDVKRAA